MIDEDEAPCHAILPQVFFRVAQKFRFAYVSMLSSRVHRHHCSAAFMVHGWSCRFLLFRVYDCLTQEALCFRGLRDPACRVDSAHLRLDRAHIFVDFLYLILRCVFCASILFLGVFECDNTLGRVPRTCTDNSTI